MSKEQAVLELRKSIQLFLSTLDVDYMAYEMLEVPRLFPKYKVGKSYKTKDVFSYGDNSVGDPQLYQVLQDHVSSEDWIPGYAPSLYKAVGMTDDGYPEWVQPLGAADAYNTGDVVSYMGSPYCSLMDGNIWAPDVYPQGWEVLS